MKPFIKWVGGKRRLAPHVAKLLPDTIERYYEPFLGGGAVFLHIHDRVGVAELSDVNPELVNVWKMVRAMPESVVVRYELFRERHSKPFYLKVRDMTYAEMDALTMAARMLYLNRASFSGMYGIRKDGTFTISWGQQKEVPSLGDRLEEASKVLRRARITTKNWRDVEVVPGSVVYADPPYWKTKVKYVTGAFTEQDQADLARMANVWREGGCHVVLSNFDCEPVRDLYAGWKFTSIRLKHTVRKGDDFKYPELLIHP